MAAPRRKSIFTPQGALQVWLQPDEVSWFDFLYFSRVSNSQEGGWNSKSHWWDEGVEPLASTAAAGVQRWTINSLRNSPYLPEPRTGDFRFDRVDSTARRALLDRWEGYATPLLSASEHELSYALYDDRTAQCRFRPFGDVKILGYEIPLSDAADGQLRVDLFGLSEDRTRVAIVELKKARNESDSPLLAFTEAICYAMQTIRCREHLLQDECLRESQTAFRHINLTLLAPPEYWAYWCGNDGVPRDRHTMQSRFETIVSQVNSSLKELHIDTGLSVSLADLVLA